VTNSLTTISMLVAAILAIVTLVDRDVQAVYKKRRRR
jgi:hypothetical protein